MGRLAQDVTTVTAVIEVEGLRKAYGATQAVRGITFSVDRGEVVAVVGPNGAGKTTTVEILEGYRERDGGQARVLGMDPATGGVALRERIGIVLQECAIDANLNVREVVQMHAEYYRAPRPVDEVIALVGLEEKAGSRVRLLSGGQQRRLDLALGLIGDPELLFLDEPTTGFDPSARRHAWGIVKGLCELGKTILLTTHYMDEAQALADRVIVIAHGEIVAQGPPDSLGGGVVLDARIRFLLPDGAAADDLPVPVASCVDGAVVVETSEPTKVLHELTGWSLARGQELTGLSLARPSLEDVNLELTAESEEAT